MQRHSMRYGANALLLISGLFAITLPQRLLAQEAGKTAPDSAKASTSRGQENYERFLSSSVDRVYKVKYATSTQDQNEFLTALRNMADPQTKIFLVPNTGMIAVHAPEDVQASLAKLLTALDQPHPRYRLTYTLTELDGGRKIGVQHFSMVVIAGQHTTMKQGSRLPILTGSGVGQQFTYIDVGMNFDVALTEVQGGGILKSKVEQSSAVPDTDPTNRQPVLRQTTLEGTSLLVVGRSLLLGSIDVPSSTRHFDVEVVMEAAN